MRAIARRRSALVAEPRGRFGNAASVRARRRQAGGSSTTGPGGGPTLTVGPGDMAVLRAGDRTTWTVHETLRKAYAISL
ncbi:cupin domain-containing protein [Streptomyces sp. TLI_185]|uniref:cupin domain-containing protein n=1 Tax=Streptomyces sp. TLI_185 TaxID=2485151 RepID=UPI0037D9DA4E